MQRAKVCCLGGNGSLPILEPTVSAVRLSGVLWFSDAGCYHPILPLDRFLLSYLDAVLMVVSESKEGKVEVSRSLSAEDIPWGKGTGLNAVSSQSRFSHAVLLTPVDIRRLPTCTAGNCSPSSILRLEIDEFFNL
jgi:hypothetical protein